MEDNKKLICEYCDEPIHTDEVTIKKHDKRDIYLCKNHECHQQYILDYAVGYKYYGEVYCRECSDICRDFDAMIPIIDDGQNTKLKYLKCDSCNEYLI